MSASDYYKVLGVSRTADSAAVRSAYRQLALRWHPDKNPSDPVGATEVFKRVHEAYAVLSDPSARAAYDALIEDSRVRSGATADDPSSADRSEAEQVVDSAARVGVEYGESMAHADIVKLLAFLDEFLGASVSLVGWLVSRGASGLRTALRDYTSSLDAFNEALASSAKARRSVREITGPMYFKAAICFIASVATPILAWPYVGGWSLIGTLLLMLVGGHYSDKITYIHGYVGGTDPRGDLITQVLAALRRK